MATAPLLTADQRANANTIIATASKLGAGSKGAVLAIMAALQESDLKNIPGGDRDSLGLFQQRPSMGWGTPAQIMDPVYSTTSFFKGHGTNPGLLTIPGWQNMPEWQAIQAVQRSGYPQAYQKHLEAATAIVGGNVAGGAASATGAPVGLLGSAVDPGRIIALLVGVVLVLLAVARISGVASTVGDVAKLAVKIKSGKVLR